MLPKLYKVNMSPPARAVMMVADILGIRYNGIETNPVARDQDEPDMVEKNPMKTIPIWEEDGFCLADSHAIILYLFDKYAKPEHQTLYPKDRQKQATINQRLFFDCGILFPRLSAVMGPTYRGKLTELSKLMIKQFDYSYSVLDKYFEKNKYVADDIITLADISIFTTMSSIAGIYPIDGERFPNLLRWYKNMSEKDFCKKYESSAKMHSDSLLMVMNINKENFKTKNKL